MVEWSGREMEYPYEDEALKFVDKISPVILDATTVSKMPVNPPNLKDNRRKIKYRILLCQKENMRVFEHFNDFALKEPLRES
jgi:hypothetical protein